MRIAIQPDYVRQPGGQEQSFSARWMELADQRGIKVEQVNVFAHDALDIIAECDGFMWRYGYGATDLAFAKRFLAAVEHGVGIPVFPNWETSWHFEDKISQAYLLEAAGIPCPKTWVFWDEDDAFRFCESVEYPFVAKLSWGIRSNNVKLVQSRPEAERLIRQMFRKGVRTLQPTLRDSIGAIGFVRRMRNRPASTRQSGYFLAQEFLANNAFDTRVTVIGDRAFAFRRFNRDGDFRASGSGKISWDPEAIDPATIRLAFDVAQKLGTQSVAIDGMRRGDDRLVGEISYTYAAWAIAECPGHWTKDGAWILGSKRAEDAIFEDFVAGLNRLK